MGHIKMATIVASAIAVRKNLKSIRQLLLQHEFKIKKPKITCFKLFLSLSPLRSRASKSPPDGRRPQPNEGTEQATFFILPFALLALHTRKELFARKPPPPTICNLGLRRAVSKARVHNGSIQPAAQIICTRIVHFRGGAGAKHSARFARGTWSWWWCVEVLAGVSVIDVSGWSLLARFDVGLWFGLADSTSEFLLVDWVENNDLETQKFIDW